jgi:metal-responsive CopG/Arc/MetJ family transcriptional regulator
MGHLTCRVPDTLSEQYERAVEERGAFRSEIVRRALRYYAQENPDEIRAFTAESGRTHGAAQGGRGEVEEARVDPAEAAETGRGSETGDTRRSPVYDPTEDT